MQTDNPVRTIRKAALDALPHFLLFIAFGVLLLWGTSRYPESLQVLPVSEYLVPLFNGFGLICIGMGIAKMMINVFDPHMATKTLSIEIVRDGNVAAGIAYAGRCILTAAIIFILSASISPGKAAGLTPQATQYVPTLQAEQQHYWPALRKVSYMAGQIEQESNWKPTAELKTAREQGVGFGQQTRAYNSMGAVRFDALTEIVKKYPTDLNGYSWTTWKQVPMLQMRATVLMTRDLCNGIKDTATQEDMFRMCLAAYNGGLGGLNKERLSCRAKAGCNAAVWFNHVELTSFKSKVPIAGYGGQSPYSINRGYITNIEKRRVKYEFIDLT